MNEDLMLDLMQTVHLNIIINSPEELYYQQTRLQVTGNIVLSSERRIAIGGCGWIDHQGFIATYPWQNWQWRSIQLDNNVEFSNSGDFSACCSV